jgi:hypothetical protein
MLIENIAYLPIRFVSLVSTFFVGPKSNLNLERLHTVKKSRYNLVLNLRLRYIELCIRTNVIRAISFSPGAVILSV